MIKNVKSIPVFAAIVVIMVIMAEIAFGQVRLFGSVNVIPGFYWSGPAGRNMQEFRLFPFMGGPISVPLPFPLGRIAYATEGSAIYVETAPKFNQGLRIARIELEPLNVTPVSGSAVFDTIYSMATANGERIIVSARVRSPRVECGIYELEKGQTAARKILSNTDCGYASTWIHLSVSSDGHLCTAVRKNALEVIDLNSGTVNVLTHGVLDAALSPDGRLIAALESADTTRVLLTDVAHWSRLRQIDASGVTWSPDSKYLLGFSETGCHGYSGTLEITDVATGKRQPIQNSKCKVNQSTIGWIRFPASR